ncbi:Anaphase-promoting complex (APC), subunit 11 [Handroanthus impetiginosus]|uniref:Anaphase-promoting complex (APC), subunit 11 n=1 Tax=Handroanthus impetiginosus TaxID=429701 RepID=A0A2G9HML5_9LAMI|nr:Anaphase-promoting complex (APC), subunit 11 [Handroanthus impetiginosus]
MDENQQIEVHYMDGGYSYPVSEGFMDFFGGVSAAPLHYVNMGLMHNQESAYWSMHMNSYKYGPSSSESTSYYGLYEDNDHASRMDFSRSAWEYPSVTTIEESIAVDIPSEQNTGPSQNTILAENTVSAAHSTPEERSANHQDAVNSEALWEDDIDPDNMTYEELLDLGEAVGAESRGLSQELINRLPTSKHKSGGIFSRRKSGDRCVICQMRYKRGDRQINLPCKHAYHTDCGSKWLSINNTCPVCNAEVFGDEWRQ